MKTGPKDFFKPGDWNAICDRCGFKYKASELKLEWTGWRVCKDCYDVRHPQELIRVPKDDPSVPWARPEPPVTERNPFEPPATGFVFEDHGGFTFDDDAGFVFEDN